MYDYWEDGENEKCEYVCGHLDGFQGFFLMALTHKRLARVFFGGWKVTVMESVALFCLTWCAL